MPETTLWNHRFIFLLLTQAGFGFAHSSFLMLPKYLTTELNAGPEEIGIVVAVSAISVVFFLIPAGSMVDRHGRKYFLTAGTALMALASAGYVYVHEIGVYLYVLRLLQSLAFAYAYAAGAALCVDAAPANRLAHALGLFGLAYVVTGAIAPAAVEAIVERQGWDAAFMLAASAATLCGLLSLFIREERIDHSATTHVPFLTIVRHPEMLRGAIVIGLLGIAFGCAFNFYQPYALSLGIYELRNFFIANSIAAASCRIALGPFIDRIGLRRVSLASLVLYAIVILAMAWLDDFGLPILGLGLGVAHGLFSPAYTAIILSGCPPAERGRRLAIIHAGLNIGIATSGIVLGWIAARWGYAVIFQLASTALIAGVYLIARDPKARALQSPQAAEPVSVR
jgi:MFS family permease